MTIVIDRYLFMK